MYPDRQLPPDLRDWPDEWRQAYEERAAIMEFDAHMPRGEAEALAIEAVRAEFAALHG